MLAPLATSAFSIRSMTPPPDDGVSSQWTPNRAAFDVYATARSCVAARDRLGVMLEGSLIHQHSTENRITPDSPTRPEGRLRKKRPLQYNRLRRSETVCSTTLDGATIRAIVRTASAVRQGRVRIAGIERSKSVNPRDVFTKGLDLPRGHERQRSASATAFTLLTATESPGSGDRRRIPRRVRKRSSTTSETSTHIGSRRALKHLGERRTDSHLADRPLRTAPLP